MTERRYRTLGKFTPAVKTETLKRQELADSLWAGEVNEFDFAQLALKLGLTVPEINRVLANLREEDGTL